MLRTFLNHAQKIPGSGPERSMIKSKTVLKQYLAHVLELPGSFPVLTWNVPGGTDFFNQDFCLIPLTKVHMFELGGITRPRDHCKNR